jgi:deferrochelatase/peroxidase EfeB
MTEEIESASEHKTISRRRFLGLGAIFGTSAVLATAPVARGALRSPEMARTKSPATAAAALQSLSFSGAHQHVILAEPSRVSAFASFDVTAGTRRELEELFRTLTARMRLLYEGGQPENAGPAAPADDNGILGPVIPRHAIGFVLGLGASLFDDRYGLRRHRPAHLTAMQSFPNDNLDQSRCHGDVAIQFMAENEDVVLHALRDITKHTRGAMQPRWRIDAFTSPARPAGTPRNLLGFKDGIANPAVDDAEEMNRLVWVKPTAAEPRWTTNGSYLVVRVIRMLVEFWDRVSVTEQENMIGRRRDSGAPLDSNGEFARPDYATDPRGNIIPLDAHIRLANPRTKNTEDSRILRRGFNYDRGVDVNGNLDQGLLFTCYQQDIGRQFEAVQRRLANEPLVDYISPVGGGYFFCPPGLGGRDGYFAEGLFV